ncbi:carboxymuconolactone decarboxylase family protein [Yinghuangia sp. ASG 101]|uniref:carboxymuconolactone decarboxylase family protein n=1 Tax=Yinghuangia sp. ASG 101 TaxID=2896848 RepID=UPI001E2B5445|nr:carboxymuconolactone decarboxylase family protein [Yinghuangia sp. ASG 101]UGQ09942.1 carboxymuconolactone decarboxylase family protein [Yinghuangia sp. ASG 101]
MRERALNMQATAPEGYKAVLGLEKYARANVERTLYHLVKTRASVINGCAFCVDMHTQDALAEGEDVRRLFGVTAWREVPHFFNARERAALALTDAVTRISEGGVPDDVWAEVHAVFDEREAADLLLAISTINVWNRLAISTHMRPPNPPKAA